MGQGMKLSEEGAREQAIEREAYARGRADERLAVIAWMREDADRCECRPTGQNAAAILRIAAGTIEEGDHVAGESE